MTHTELIARLRHDARVDSIMGDDVRKKDTEKAADAIEKLEAEVERLTSEAMYCSEYSEPEDLMFERLERAARTSFRKHKSSIRGQQITRADSYESHLVWAAQQEMKAQLAAAQTEVERLGMALHGYQVAIETAEESLKDRVALAMEVDRLSAAGVSHCGHRPPCIECRKYAAPIAQQPSVPEGWKPVPIEPTEAMLEVGFFAENDVFDSAKTKRIHVWKDMLAAAPQPKETK